MTATKKMQISEENVLVPPKVRCGQQLFNCTNNGSRGEVLHIASRSELT